jgi:hypothetical protein
VDESNPHRIPWYTVRGASGLLYAGPNRREAEASRDAAAALGRDPRMTEGWEYAPPERNDLCRCRGYPLRQMLCSWGHQTECHYPQECREARCAHLEYYDEVPPDHPGLLGQPAEAGTASWLAAGIRESDTVFEDSPDAGEPTCLCSRCGRVIGEDDMPVRAYEEGSGTRRRYHPACLGMQVYADPGEDDPDPYQP